MTLQNPCRTISIFRAFVFRAPTVKDPRPCVTFSHIRAAFPVIGAAILMAMTTPAAAGFVSSLNTGLDSNGRPLERGAFDPSYAMIKSADAELPGPDMYVSKPATEAWPFYPGIWLPDSEDSRWLVPYTDGYLALPMASGPGNYTFRTSFDLTGYDPSSALISGRWAVDEAGFDILLNGVSAAMSTAWIGYRSFTDFSVTKGFRQGVNTLDFVVSNIDLDFGNPIGLRVEGLVTASAIPAPSSIALLMAGLLPFALFMSKHNPPIFKSRRKWDGWRAPVSA